MFIKPVGFFRRACFHFKCFKAKFVVTVGLQNPPESRRKQPAPPRTRAGFLLTPTPVLRQLLASGFSLAR